MLCPCPEIHDKSSANQDHDQALIRHQRLQPELSKLNHDHVLKPRQASSNAQPEIMKSRSCFEAALSIQQSMTRGQQIMVVFWGRPSIIQQCVVDEVSKSWSRLELAAISSNP